MGSKMREMIIAPIYANLPSDLQVIAEAIIFLRHCTMNRTDFRTVCCYSDLDLFGLCRRKSSSQRPRAPARSSWLQILQRHR
jgi:hypothetical protein